MRVCLIFCAMLLTACEQRELLYVEHEIPAVLTTPCAKPVKSAATEGGFVELTLGWKRTAECNADKLNSIAAIVQNNL
ncbi:hypothetical protein BZA02_11120 [Ruegeria sp. P4]|nr:hypothetical protein BZA02_11120 [Ruegeria sp. P4]